MRHSPGEKMSLKPDSRDKKGIAAELSETPKKKHIVTRRFACH